MGMAVLDLHLDQPLLQSLVLVRQPSTRYLRGTLRLSGTHGTRAVLSGFNDVVLARQLVGIIRTQQVVLRGTKWY